jgi:hypothetical protein
MIFLDDSGVVTLFVIINIQHLRHGRLFSDKFFKALLLVGRVVCDQPLVGATGFQTQYGERYVNMRTKSVPRVLIALFSKF